MTPAPVSMVSETQNNPAHVPDLLRPEVLAAFDRAVFERDGYWVWDNVLTDAGRRQFTASLQNLQDMNDRILMETDWAAIDYESLGLPRPAPGSDPSGLHTLEINSGHLHSKWYHSWGQVNQARALQVVAGQVMIWPLLIFPAADTSISAGLVSGGQASLLHAVTRTNRKAGTRGLAPRNKEFPLPETPYFFMLSSIPSATQA